MKRKKIKKDNSTVH